MDHPEPRIADADRDRVSGQLRVAYAEGRITEAELEERLMAVFQARTASELGVVVADLPDSSLPQAQAGRAPRSWNVDVRPAIPLLFPAMVCTIIYVLTNPGGYFWPAWVWLGCGIPAFYAVVGNWGGGDDEGTTPPEVTA